MTWLGVNWKRLGPLLPVALLLLFALAACGGDQSATAVIESSPPPRQVKIATAVEAKVARTVSATGTLAAEDQVVLGTKSSAGSVRSQSISEAACAKARRLRASTPAITGCAWIKPRLLFSKPEFVSGSRPKGPAIRSNPSKQRPCVRRRLLSRKLA